MKIVSCSDVDNVCVRQQECYAEFLDMPERCPGVKEEDSPDDGA